MPAGTELSRRCLCPKWEQICPVHIFSRALAKSNQVIPSSGKVFHFSYDYFLRELRRVLRELGIEGADSYSTKAFRRGTAQEILENGGGLGEVCKAAQWSSDLAGMMDKMGDMMGEMGIDPEAAMEGMVENAAGEGEAADEAKEEL